MDVVLQNFRRSFVHPLSLDPLETMEELYRRVDRYSMLEDNIRAATQIVMITSKPAESNKPVGKKPFESKEGQSRNQK